MVNIALIGSTGSIGRQVLNTVRRYKEKFRIVSLAAKSSTDILQKQIEEFRPEVVALADAEKAADIRELPEGVFLYTGENAYLHAVTENCDVVFVAVSGFAGLAPTLEAISAKKTVALANKESLVAGGELVTSLAAKNGVDIVPVDSEHSAVFQCLGFEKNRPFRRIILTASGGAFRDFDKRTISGLKAEAALKHPNWLMGKKITIDCATMLNKGLEVIEACRLYDAPLEKVKAVVHPESVIHSMVEFCDGAVMAQLGFPSMEIPIQLALTYPERYPTNVPYLSFEDRTLTFRKIDEDRFPCFTLAINSYKEGDNYPCAMNAANEVAVNAYLSDEIGFYDINRVIDGVLSKTERLKPTYENLIATDLRSRAAAEEIIKNTR